MHSQQPADPEVCNPPSDSVSEIAFSSKQDLLAAASWDTNVRVWEVSRTGNSKPVTMYAHEGPALSCSWSKDGGKLASGGADKTARVMDAGTGQSQQVAAHDAPVRCVRFFELNGQQILATGSYDKTVKCWDLRTPAPVAALQMPERVYSMDIVYPYMVVGTAERQIQTINLMNPSSPPKTIVSPLKWQTRCISCFPAKHGNGMGYAVGSIEGRVAIQYIDKESNNFSFKCHKDAIGNPFAVNAMSFHPLYNTFSTAGADGKFIFWDKDSKQRLKNFGDFDGPISSTAFNRDGSVFAYAIGYDWHKGHTGQSPNRIHLHAVKRDDIAPRPKKH